MTTFELLEAKVSILEKRIKQLEIRAEYQKAGSADDLEAQRLAQEKGFNVDLVFLPDGRGKQFERDKKAAQRIALARELRYKRNWSLSRIARALKRAERTVERWFSDKDNQTGPGR